MTFPCPQLLVSVRDPEEARVAIQFGVPILDIKDPTAGSLGMASPATICRILDVARQSPFRPMVSAALGEVIEWPSRRAVELPSGLAYVKLGLAGLGTAPDWQGRWLAVRDQINRQMQPHEHRPAWVAVAYVDHLSANAPPPNEVITAAHLTGCRGVLFDTWSKASGTLLDRMSARELRWLIARIRDLGMFAAAAGRLTPSALPAVVEAGADIVAVRSAACVCGDRSGRIDPAAIRNLQAILGYRPPVEVCS